MKLITIIISLAIACTAFASLSEKTLDYTLNGTAFESTIVYHTDADTSLPGILMVPNWMGPTEDSLEKARMVAQSGYIVMMVDMYGTDTRPQNAGEAGSAAGAVRSDRALMRARANKALEVFREASTEVNLQSDDIAAIGFCFGGGAILELGRSGADIDAIISFHGDLASPTLAADAANTQAKVLVLHGADDPYVKASDVDTFIQTMQATDVDWQFVQFSGTVHSFTNPKANSDGARYNQRSSDRAFAMMGQLLNEIWR